jgi:hypothetical protein
MLVEMADDDGFFMARLRCGTGKQFDSLAFLERVAMSRRT